MIHQREIRLETTGHGQMTDLTPDVAGIAIMCTTATATRTCRRRPSGRA